MDNKIIVVLMMFISVELDGRKVETTVFVSETHAALTLWMELKIPCPPTVIRPSTTFSYVRFKGTKKR